MYCPRCGTLIQAETEACRNCGAPPEEMEDPIVDPEIDRGSKAVLRNSRIVLWMGILAILPYLFTLATFFVSDFFSTTPSTPDWVRSAERTIIYPALIGIFSGIPFGLAAIITGIIAYLKQPGIRKSVITAIPGILLGIGGIAGNIYSIWFVATCQFCQ